MAIWLILEGQFCFPWDCRGAVVVEWRDSKALIISHFSPQEKRSFSHCLAYEPNLLQYLLKIHDLCFWQYNDKRAYSVNHIDYKNFWYYGFWIIRGRIILLYLCIMLKFQSEYMINALFLSFALDLSSIWNLWLSVVRSCWSLDSFHGGGWKVVVSLFFSLHEMLGWFFCLTARCVLKPLFLLVEMFDSCSKQLFLGIWFRWAFVLVFLRLLLLLEITLLLFRSREDSVANLFQFWSWYPFFRI